MNDYRDNSFNFWVDEINPYKEFTIYLEIRTVDSDDSDDDSGDPFGALNIPGYGLGTFLAVIGISIASIVKRKQK